MFSYNTVVKSLCCLTASGHQSIEIADFFIIKGRQEHAKSVYPSKWSYVLFLDHLFIHDSV